MDQNLIHAPDFFHLLSVKKARNKRLQEGIRDQSEAKRPINIDAERAGLGTAAEVQNGPWLCRDGRKVLL
jgi:hypothetical protein